MIYEYYVWLLEFVGIDLDTYNKFKQVFEVLYSREFFWSINNDVNRYFDGLSLRTEFGKQYKYSQSTIDRYFPTECSVLEVLVALANRCEYDFMHDDDYGNRINKWFMIMFKNLGLNNFDEDNFDEDDVNSIVDNFLNRQYSRNGSNGGLFIVNRKDIDMRKTEIWYQMNYYIEENYNF